MNNKGFLRLFLFSFLSALLFGAISLLGLNWLARSASGRHRNNFVFFVADSVEQALLDKSIADLKSRETQTHLREALHFFPPPPFGGFKNPPRHRPMPPPPQPALWLVTESGEILFAYDQTPFPDWKRLNKPNAIHDLASNDGILWFSSEVIV